MKGSWKRFVGCFIAFMLMHTLYAAKVDTVSVPSAAMQRQIRNVVVLPATYDGNHTFPVLYLLHGYGANHQYWVDRVPEIKEFADQFSMIIVCPDGDRGSWYWDSPENPQIRFETFITQELIPFIDENFNTISKREGRAIAGLSMGGQGALFLAFRHSDLFGAAGSMAGGVDIRPFPDNWEMAKSLGSYAENPQRWDAFAVINQIHLLTPKTKPLGLIIDCGTDDFFYHVNQELHKKLTYHQIPHTFISRPGKHELKYWGDAVRYQILYFHYFFENTDS